MAIEPKNTREQILSLYGHVKGVKREIAIMRNCIQDLGGKIDKIYWGSFSSGGGPLPYLVIDKLI